MDTNDNVFRVRIFFLICILIFWRCVYAYFYEILRIKNPDRGISEHLPPSKRKYLLCG